MNIDRGTFSWYLFPSTQNSTRRQRMLPAYRTADEPFTIPQFALTRSDIDSFMEELRGFHTAFRDCFTRQEPRDQFFNYMVGQFSPLARFFFSSRRRHTRYWRDWSSDVCSSDLAATTPTRRRHSGCSDGKP